MPMLLVHIYPPNGELIIQTFNYMKAFVSTDKSIVEQKLDSINEHFGFPNGSTKTYSKIIQTEDEQFVLPVVLDGDQDVSSFFSTGEVVDYQLPEPQEPEEAKE